jgi:hypothetical protein
MLIHDEVVEIEVVEQSLVEVLMLLLELDHLGLRVVWIS